MKRWYNKLFLNNIRKVVEKYGLIHDGDNILIGLSGGKDSIFLTYALSLLRDRSYLKFNIAAIHIDVGIKLDMEEIKSYLDSLRVPYYYEDINIVDKIHREKNPCHFCTKIKRGTIARIAKEEGFNKIAYGHHLNDLVDTFFLNMIYTGRLHVFKPNTYNEKHDLNLIRPLIYVKEDIIKKVVKEEKLPLGIGDLCPVDRENKRNEMGALVEGIKTSYPDFETKALRAIEDKFWKGLVE